MVKINKKLFGNFSRLLLFLLLLLTTSNAGNCNLHRRVKRLSSPSLTEKTIELAKYVVSIRSRTPSRYYGDNHYCGGVIVSLTFILTSAHCVMDQRKIMHRNRFVVIVAGNFIRLDYRNKYTVNRTVKGIFVPDGFTAENTHNIALIKLAKSLPLDNPNVGVINLPKAEPKPGLNYTVLGWGRMMKDGFMSSQIMSIDVELFSQESCEEMLNTFIDEMMCARNKNGDQNACAGDTGSPLILNETVYGVVSYRIGCGSEILPTVYTNVFMHLKWIEDVMKKNSANHLKPLIMFPIITPIVLLIGNKILKGFRLYLITI